MKRNINLLWHIKFHTEIAIATELIYIYIYLVALHCVHLPGDGRGNIKEPTQADIDKYKYLSNLINVHNYFRE